MNSNQEQNQSFQSVNVISSGKSQNLKLMLLLLVFLFIGGIGGYLLGINNQPSQPPLPLSSPISTYNSPRPTPPSPLYNPNLHTNVGSGEWLTFENDKLKYTIDYPEEIYPRVNEDKDSNFQSFFDTVYKQNESGNDIPYFVIYPNWGNCETTSSNIKDITLKNGAQIALKKYNREDLSGNVVGTMLCAEYLVNGDNFMFQSPMSEATNDDRLNIVTKMLSSFTPTQ